MPRLAVLQSIWGMERRHTDGQEWSMPERFRMIREAGFDGICHHFYTESDVRTWIDAALDHGFVIEGQVFPRTVSELEPALDLACRYPVHHLTLQPDVRPYDIEECLSLLEGWRALARSAGVPLLIETHRGRMTNDLFFTHHLLDRIPEMDLLADLSHYVVGQEIELPVTPLYARMIERILDRSCGFHGRVAGTEQLQVELSFAHHRPWVDQFITWWAYGFRSWLGRAAPDDVLTFTCELGPKPVAVSGPDDNDLSNRWEEARIMKDWIRQVWNDLDEKIYK